VIESGQAQAWCKANIKRGMRDIQQVMRLAGVAASTRTLHWAATEYNQRAIGDSVIVPDNAKIFASVRIFRTVCLAA